MTEVVWKAKLSMLKVQTPWTALNTCSCSCCLKINEMKIGGKMGKPTASRVEPIRAAITITGVPTGDEFCCPLCFDNDLVCVCLCLATL